MTSRSHPAPLFQVAAGPKPTLTWIVAYTGIEILSPGDESWQKLPFYAEHHVDEVLLVDPDKRTVTWLALRDGEYEPVERSELIELGPAELAERIDWP